MFKSITNACLNLFSAIFLIISQIAVIFNGLQALQKLNNKEKTSWFEFATMQQR